MEHLSEFVLNNIVLFAALAGVLVLLIKAELDHQANKGSLLSPAMGIRLMNNNDDILVIDVRSAAEYKSGHIKGAKNAPLAEFSSSIESYSRYKNQPVLIYCNSGNTATRAIKMLKKAGFENINNLAGGIVAWKEASLPLTKK
jgi:rhodanese-related sulfurtransferase